MARLHALSTGFSVSTGPQGTFLQGQALLLQGESPKGGVGVLAAASSDLAGRGELKVEKERLGKEEKPRKKR